MFTIETVSSIAHFNDLKEEWNALLVHDRRYRPYLSHEWFQLWFSYFKDQSELLIVQVKDGDQTAAIFPFVKQKATHKGIPVTEVELAGNIASPARCFLFRPMDDSEKEAIILQVFRSLRDITNWDVMKLISLPEEMLNMNSLIRAIQGTGVSYTKSVGFGNWYLDGIDFSGDEYIRSRSRNIKRNLKRKREKLEGMGDVQFKTMTNGSRDQINAYMDLYYDVFNKSWKDWELHPTFHRDLALLASEQGWLRLEFLMIDENPIAAQLSLVCERILYSIRSFYDQTYRKMAPGILLLGEAVKNAINDDHVEEIDLLIGDEDYKQAWAPKRRERLDLIVYSNSLKGRLLSFLVLSLIPLVKKNKVMNRMKIRLSKLFGISE